MKLEKISIEKFKRINKLELDLAPINYLVGGNNAGKSSVLQAIHTAVTAAQTSNELHGWNIIPDDKIKYCPTANFYDIGHNGPLENASTGKRAIVSFTGTNDDELASSYQIELYKGRNNGAGVERSGTTPGFGVHIYKTNPPFSIYAPGLAGIPTKEEFRSQAVVLKKIAGGEANSVLRNVLYLLQRGNKLQDLTDNMKKVFPGFSIRIFFNPMADQYIEVTVRTKTAGEFMPLDMAGTGVLQALQLFSYAIYFKPNLLLLDEPDSHLHPSNQNQLIATLQTIVEKTETKIILATHSRHMINNVPEEAKLFWLVDGKLKQENDIDKIKLLNELGALDQADQYSRDLLILTEDNKKGLLKKLLSNIGVAVDRIGIASYSGVSNAKLAAHIARQLLGADKKIILHRDRDFLTEDEVNEWKTDLESSQIIPYVTEGSDLEMAFLQERHLAKLANKPVSEIRTFLEQLISENDEDWRGKFKNKRREHNRKLYQDGGGPRTEDLCNSDESLNLSHILGKELLSKVRGKSQEILGTKIDPLNESSTQTLAPELKRLIQSSL